MKILLLGDGSNYHGCLADGLRRLGHEVTVASNGSRWMGTPRDIDISRRPGVVGGALLYGRLLTSLAQRLRGYDVVSIATCGFLDLRPRRIARIFRDLRRHNGSVTLSLIGADARYVGWCADPESPLRYNEWRLGSEPSPYALASPALLPQWTSAEMNALASEIYEGVDRVMTCLYEYDLCARHFLPPEKVRYIGIPVDLDSIPFVPPRFDSRPFSIFQGCHRGREVEKGADVLASVMERLCDALPADAVDYRMVQNVPLVEFNRLLSGAHIVVDQLYSYTPATAALTAMAMGKVAVSGGEEEYYRFIGEPTLRPVVNADPLDPVKLFDRLRFLIEDALAGGTHLNALATQGREFVTRHNALPVVAARYLDALG